MDISAGSDLSLYQKLQISEKTLIHHHHFSMAEKRIKDVIRLFQNGVEARHTLLLGESGTGKSWLAEHIAASFPGGVRDGYKEIPVLIVGIPPVPTLKTFAEEILMALLDPLYYRGTASEKRARAIDLIRRCKVVCIIFDEFQHFLDETRHVKLAAVADWLKTFINEVKIPCVLVGLPRCAGVLDVNEQLRRRFSARLSLPAFSIDTAENKTQFLQLLNELDKSLPLSEISGFVKNDMATRIYFACNGLIGYARKLITDAFEKTLIENRSKIQTDILERAFNDVIWQSPSHELNPFNTKFKFRNLDRIGEPFAQAISDVRDRKRSKK